MRVVLTSVLLIINVIGNAQINVNPNDIIGTWKGEFGEKNITITIEKIQDNTIYGYNIVGKNKRNIKGDYTYSNGNIIAKLAEPGDDKYDGVFSIKFEKNTANGTWKILKGKSSKKFTLKKVKNRDKSKPNFEFTKGKALGTWVGWFNSNGIAIEITKYYKDSIFGRSILWKERENREKLFKGSLHEITIDQKKYTRATIIEYKADKFSNANDDYMFKYSLVYFPEKNIIDGLILSGENKTHFTLEKEKEEKIKQTDLKRNEIEKNLIKLEEEINTLINIYDKVLNYGRLSPKTLIEKAGKQAVKVDQIIKTNKIPSDTKELSYSQANRVSKLIILISLYKKNKKLQLLLY